MILCSPTSSPGRWSHWRRSMAKLVRPGGRVILSGLLTHQEPQVRAAYAGQGLRLAARRRLNGWSTLTYARPDWIRLSHGARAVIS